MAKLGFTFGFGARDDGMGRAMSSAFDSLTKINGALNQQNRMARGSKLGSSLKGLAKGAASAAVGTARMGAGLVGAFGRGSQNAINRFNLASMAQNIRGLTQDSGNLSLSMESIGASYAQQAKPALAMMGVTGKRLKQLTSQAAGMAYGLNVGVETVVKTMGTLETATGGTREFFDGLKMGTKDLVKLAEVSGMATDQLGQLGGDLVASWGFSGTQAKQTLEYMVAMGNEGGVGAKMFAQMGDQMGGLNEILAQQVARHMRSADEIDKMLRSSVRLAGAYASMGLSQEEAAKAATATSNKFVEWQVAIERNRDGLGDMPDIFTDLAAVIGDTQKATDLIALGSQDSSAAMAQFATYMQQARDSGRTIDSSVLGNLTKSFGEAGNNAVYLALSTDKGAAGLTKMATATVKADGALKDLAKSQSSGRTLQEGLDMAKEAFQMRIRSVTRPEVRGLVNQEIQSYREMGKEIKKLSSDATWGPLVQAYSIFDQMGAKGVMLHFGKQLGLDTKQAQKFGIGLDLAMDAVSKVQQGIAPIMETLGMGPLTGMVGGIAGWFMLPKDTRDKLWAAVEPMWRQVSTGAAKIWNEDLYPAVRQGWADFSRWFGAKVWPEITRLVGQGWTKLMAPGGLIDQGVGLIKNYFSAMWDSAGFMGKAAMVGVVGVMAGQIPGLGGVINGVVSMGLQGGLSAGVSAAGKIPGFFGLAGILLGIGTLAIEGWFAFLNWRLDAQLAESTKKIDAQWARAKDLGSATKYDTKKLTANFGATGTEGDVSLNGGKVDKALKEAVLGQRDYAAMVGKGKGTQPGQGLNLGLMQDRFAKVQGLPAFQMEAQAIEARVNAADYSSSGGLAQQDFSRKKALYTELDALNKAWGAKGQAQIDQMAIQGANLATRLGEVYGVAVAGPSEELIAKANAAGIGLLSQMATGVSMETPKFIEEWDKPFDYADSTMPHSPPLAGPLAGMVLQDGGSGMLEQILIGMQTEQGNFEIGFATVLEEATTFAMNAFYAKAQEEMRNNSITTEILGQLTGQFAGILTEDDKKVLKSSLDLSGLYGVINAVVLDGAETRKVLTSIADNTAGLKGWTPGKGSGWEITKPAGAAGGGK